MINMQNQVVAAHIKAYEQELEQGSPKYLCCYQSYEHVLESIINGLCDKLQELEGETL